MLFRSVEELLSGQLEEAANVVDAIWKAKIIVTGGSTVLRTLLNRYQPMHLDTVPFWSEVIVFLVKNEALAITNVLSCRAYIGLF